MSKYSYDDVISILNECMKSNRWMIEFNDITYSSYKNSHNISQYRVNNKKIFLYTGNSKKDFIGWIHDNWDKHNLGGKDEE